MNAVAWSEQDLRRRVGELEALVRRQMDMLERYDRTLSLLDSPVAASRQEAARSVSREEYERLVGLLDRAVSRAEQLDGDKQRLQANLDRTLNLLDEAIRQQERMMPPRAASPAAANPAAVEAPPPAARGDERVAATLARYDSMLERSLSALDNAYRVNGERDRQIEERDARIRERDQLLERTLAALQKAIEEESARIRDNSSRRSFSRLFG